MKKPFKKFSKSWCLVVHILEEIKTTKINCTERLEVLSLAHLEVWKKHRPVEEAKSLEKGIQKGTFKNTTEIQLTHREND